MSDRSTNLFAFPVPENAEAYGLTMRDWFAGMALAGICSSEPGPHHIPRQAANGAYVYADAMLAAREEKA